MKQRVEANSSNVEEGCTFKSFFGNRHLGMLDIFQPIIDSISWVDFSTEWKCVDEGTNNTINPKETVSELKRKGLRSNEDKGDGGALPGRGGLTYPPGMASTALPETVAPKMILSEPLSIACNKAQAAIVIVFGVNFLALQTSFNAFVSKQKLERMR